jgi:hypothetical protein
LRFLENPDLTTEKQNPPEIPAGFRKTCQARSEIPPEQKKMPHPAFQRGSGDHRLGWFNEHFDRMLR